MLEVRYYNCARVSTVIMKILVISITLQNSIRKVNRVDTLSFEWFTKSVTQPRLRDLAGRFSHICFPGRGAIRYPVFARCNGLHALLLRVISFRCRVPSRVLQTTLPPIAYGMTRSGLQPRTYRTRIQCSTKSGIASCFIFELSIWHELSEQCSVILLLGVIFLTRCG